MRRSFHLASSWIWWGKQKIDDDFDCKISCQENSFKKRRQGHRKENFMLSTQYGRAEKWKT